MMNAKEQIEKNTTEYDEARLEEALDILVQMRAVDKAKGYRRIMASVNRGTRRRRFILWSRYAAIVVVIVVVGVIWGVRGRVDRVVPVMQAQEIVPGGMKARLILATGENVVLDTLTLETASIWEAGATIRKNGGVLTYENARKEEVRPMEVMYNTLEVPRGGEYDLVLEDGTCVWLNADSRLKYPVVFPGSERRVMLEGEAYFEVARDTESAVSGGNGGAIVTGVGNGVQRVCLSGRTGYLHDIGAWERGVIDWRARTRVRACTRRTGCLSRA